MMMGDSYEFSAERFSSITLKLAGQLNDGTQIEGQDDIVIIQKGKK